MPQPCLARATPRWGRGRVDHQEASPSLHQNKWKYILKTEHKSVMCWSAPYPLPPIREEMVRVCGKEDAAEYLARGVHRRSAPSRWSALAGAREAGRSAAIWR